MSVVAAAAAVVVAVVVAAAAAAAALLARGKGTASVLLAAVMTTALILGSVLTALAVTKLPGEAKTRSKSNFGFFIHRYYRPRNGMISKESQ